MIALGALAFHVLLLLAQYFVDRRNFTVFNPKVLFQVYLIIQLPVVLMLATTFDLTGFNALSPNTSSDTVLLISSMSLLAQVFFLVGYYTCGRNRMQLPFCARKDWSISRANLVSGVFFATGYLAFLALINMNGGYSAFMENREAWRAGGMSGQGWLLFPATSMIAIGAMIVLITHREFFARKHGWRWAVLLLVATVLPASQLGFRGMVLAPAMQLLFIYHYRVKPLDFTKTILPLAALAIFFTGYGIYREITFVFPDGFRLEQVTNFVAENPELSLAVLLRSKGADIVAVVLEGIRNGISHVYIYPSIIEALSIVIPRSLWDGKSTPLSVQFSEEFFGLGGGVSPTVVGEAYWHAGFVGIVVILFAIGAGMRLYWNMVQAQRDNNSVLLLCVAIFPALFLMAESMQSQLNSIAILAMFAVMVLLVLRMKI